MKLTTISKWNKEKGVAGLNIFLSLISMLFMIGILVMAFVLAGSKLEDAISDDNDAVQAINQTKTAISGATDWFSTFIVLGAIVVLVLLVVIIINSIKQTDLSRGA